MSKIHKKTGYMCIICDEPITGQNNSFIFHKTRRQTHSLCIDCGISYLKPILKNILNNIRINIRKNVDMIKCPGSYHSLKRNSCKCIKQLKDLVIPESIISLDIFRIIYTLSNPGTYLCQDEKCGGVIEIDPQYFGNNVKCIGCKTTWCKECLVTPFHEGKSCIEVEAENKISDNGKFIYEMKKQGLLKFCPQCRVTSIKNDGCNKMVCFRCQVTWCWLCENANVGYDHYNMNLVGSCNGKLWQGVDADGNALPNQALVPIR